MLLDRSGPATEVDYYYSFFYINEPDDCWVLTRAFTHKQQQEKRKRERNQKKRRSVRTDNNERDSKEKATFPA